MTDKNLRKFPSYSRAAMVWCLVSLLFILPYLFDAWWKFVPASLCILGTLRWWNPSHWIEYSGLRIRPLFLLSAIFLMIPIFFLFNLFVSKRLDALGWMWDRSFYHYGWMLMPIFQVLNEEILLRGWMLSLLELTRLNRTIIVVVSALFFSVIHLGFYPLTQGGPLSIGSAMTLFFVGLVCNFLFFIFRSIALPYALHASWNLNQYGQGMIVDQVTGARVLEFQSFNALVGNNVVVGTTLFLAVLSWLVYRKSDLQISKS